MMLELNLDECKDIGGRIEVLVPANEWFALTEQLRPGQRIAITRGTVKLAEAIYDSFGAFSFDTEVKLVQVSLRIVHTPKQP